MNTSSTPKNQTSTHPADKHQPPKPTLILQTPKLLLPTLASLVTTALLFGLIYPNFFIRFNSSLMILRELIYVLLLVLVPALGLFLLHRLLEVIILHRAFRPAHLISTLAILLSVAVFYFTDIVYYWVILYTLAGIIFAASLSFQKSHSLAADPAHFHSSLLSTAAASFILGLISLALLAVYAFSPAINTPVTNIFFSISVIVTLPLELALTFLCLTKLAPARSARLLSRFDLAIIIASFLLATISTAAYLAVAERTLASTRVSTTTTASLSPIS